jgi:toxin ParE1/3/4
VVEKIIWTKKSLADLRIIYDYINSDSPFYAKLTVQQIISKSELIRTLPLAGRVVPEFADPTIREFLLKDFKIIYRIQNSIAYLVRIYHSSRLLRSL